MLEMQTIARPYAKAIFKSGLEQSSLEQWEEILSLLADILSEPRVVQAIESKSHKNVEQRIALLASLLDRKFLPGEVSLLTLLDGKKRLTLLPAIQQLVKGYVLEEKQTVSIEVESAFPLETNEIEDLVEVLSQYFKQKVIISTYENKELIGGIVIRAMDQVIDMSMLGRLNKLKQAMSVG